MKRIEREIQALRDIEEYLTTSEIEKILCCITKSTSIKTSTLVIEGRREYFYADVESLASLTNTYDGNFLEDISKNNIGAIKELIVGLSMNPIYMKNILRQKIDEMPFDKFLKVFEKVAKIIN